MSLIQTDRGAIDDAAIQEVMDVTDSTAVDGLFRELKRRFKTLDVLTAA
jgi:NADP-dependent 3-hydroxy acid dehydrogenase YdfG